MDDKYEVKFITFILSWFPKNKRDFPWRNDVDPYRILIAEKMLQQTDYGHVLKVYNKFLDKYPDVYSLSQAETDQIESMIHPLGLQRLRAPQMKNMAETIVSAHLGKVPSSKQGLLSLDGVGEYISDAVLCFAFHIDTPVVDVNVRKVLGRVLNWNLKDKEISTRLSALIPKGKFEEFNLGIIDFSSKVCSRKPKCPNCGISNSCHFFSYKSTSA